MLLDIEGCNWSFVTNDPNFLGRDTAFIGYANP